MAKRSLSDPKHDSLRQQGILNRRPQTVTDELFGQGEFFDARDLVQVKYEMLRRVQKEGRPVSTTAAAFGFLRFSITWSIGNTLLKWLSCDRSADRGD